MFPLGAQFGAASEDVGPGFFETLEDAVAFDDVAGAAGGDEVVRLLRALASAGKDEVHGHHQGVLEVR
jgi:hypothetical protein